MTTVAVTGASGYVGGRVVAAAQRRGWHVISVGRRPVPGTEHRPFDLGSSKPVDLSGADAVVHAAHDFTVTNESIIERNLTGSRLLLRSCQEHHVRPVLVSSLSAFHGCRSRYGAVKLQLEGEWAEHGGTSLRAGVVFGFNAGGIFGSLTRVVANLPFVPMVGPRSTPFYVTHDLALADALLEAASDDDHTKLTLAAHREPVSFWALLQHLASGLGRPLRTVPVPAWTVRLSLSLGEAVGIRLPFRSDSVHALTNSIPASQVALLPSARGTFPGLDVSLWT